MTYNWKLPAFFFFFFWGLFLWKILKRLLNFVLLSFYKRGGGETPSEQGLCRESASDFGTFHPQKFPSWWLVWGSGFYVCFLIWKNKHFYRARKLVSRKGSPGWQQMDQCLCWVLLFFGTMRGEWFLEVRVGPRGREKCLCLGTEELGSSIAFLHLLLAAALPREPALLRLQDQTSASIFPSTGAKKHKGKEENLYIYNIKSLGD